MTDQLIQVISWYLEIHEFINEDLYLLTLQSLCYLQI
jgi:hypothetical protein